METAIATAVIALAAGGALAALGAFGRYTSHQAGPTRTAATELAEQTLRLAQDAWKYGALGSAPSGSVAARLPAIAPGAPATTAPAMVTATISNASASDAQITVTVRYTPDPGHPSDPGSVTITGIANVQAPPPGSQVDAPAAIPAPSGAP